jgi:hypothetical protein
MEKSLVSIWSPQGIETIIFLCGDGRQKTEDEYPTSNFQHPGINGFKYDGEGANRD